MQLTLTFKHKTISIYVDPELSFDELVKRVKHELMIAEQITKDHHISLTVIGKFKLSEMMTKGKNTLSSLNITEGTQFDISYSISAKLFYGPRRKTMSTHYLECIIYAMLDKDTEVYMNYDEKGDCQVRFNRNCFNLTSILKKTPDFEHFSFTKQQLDVYLERLEDKRRFFGLHAPKQPSYLHPAERLALHYWTLDLFNSDNGRIQLLSYSSIQSFLRSFARKPSLIALIEPSKFLTTICIAAHGLSKSPPSISSRAIISYRGERDNDFLEARITAARAVKPIRNTGFTASSIRYQNCFGNIKTEIFQAPSLNPIGKNIGKLSDYSREQEVLFPPNTEFAYIQESDTQWKAYPIRGINQEKDKNDTHIVPDEIYQMKVKFKLKSLYNFLMVQKIKNTHSKFKKFFDTVDNTKKLDCFTLVIDMLKDYIRLDKV